MKFKVGDIVKIRADAIFKFDWVSEEETLFKIITIKNKIATIVKYNYNGILNIRRKLKFEYIKLASSTEIAKYRISE